MHGYYLASSLFANVPELAIFRRFSAAHALNVLVLQAEVVRLHHTLGKIANAQHKQDIDAGREPLDESVRRLEAFRTPDDQHCPQWRLIIDLRSKLKEYHEALIQFKTACQSPAARRVNLKAVQTWLRTGQGGNRVLEKVMIESDAWDHESDLTSILDAGHNDDAVSRWFNEKFLGWFYNTVGYRFKPNELPLWEPALSDNPVTVPLDIYPESTVSTFVTGLSTVLSSLMPCLSIFLLYYVRPPVVRLSIILALSLTFSLAMALIAKAKRSDCFTATATFAAVLVVFVGSTDTSNCNKNTVVS